MGYLLYVSHDAENLQFFLWLQDYNQRFQAAHLSEQALSPPWDEDVLPPPIGNIAADRGPRVSDKTLAQTLDYKISLDTKDLPLSPIGSPLHEKASFTASSKPESDKSELHLNVQQATDSGLKWKPCNLRHCNYVCAGLTVPSFYPAISFRDRSNYCPLPGSWCASGAQPIRQESRRMCTFLNLFLVRF